MRRLMIVLTVLSSFWVATTPLKEVEATSSFTESSSLDLFDVSGFVNVVIFIRFQDETTYTAPYSLDDYETLFNGVDTVSLRDYYQEVSYNQLTIDSYLVSDNNQFIYYTDIYDRGYYEPYDSVNNPIGYTDSNRNSREHELLKRAVDFVEAQNIIPDTIDLDANNDGDIDSITFLVSGEANEWNDLFWPHKWELTTYFNYGLGTYDSDAPMINGLHAFHYTFELLGNSTSYKYRVSVPIVTHETFHLISAPDLYHYYRYDWIDAVGDWGIMGSVTEVPSHMLGYMKYQYGGWIDEVDEITASGTYTLYPMQDSPDNLYRIDTGYDNEFVYIEYRDQTGVYESNTPNAGLIVYRVDLDYYDEGNVQGYYLEDGITTAEEVFVFRPGILDTVPLITFDPTDSDLIDEDGDIDNAALSQYNLYDEMGIGTDIMMFHSDGSLMKITITNVVEYDGYITFDVMINAPRITVVSEYDLPDIEDVHFVDAPYTYYAIELVDIHPDLSLYYTLDGTAPTVNSTFYTDGEIEISASLNHLQAILVDEEEHIISFIDETFDFVTTFETPHTNYGSNVLEYWLLSFPQVTDYSISFDPASRIASTNDSVTIYSDSTETTYGGNQLSNVTVDYLNQGLLLEFTTDAYNNNYYGFTGVLSVHAVFENIGFTMNGDEVVYLEVFEPYTDAGIILAGYGSEHAYTTVESNVDTSQTGEYTVIYHVYNETNDYIGSLTRTVFVRDHEAPTIELVGESDIYLEVFEDYIEPGVIIEDNYLLTGSYVVTGTVNETVLGDYILTYYVLDDAGNQSEQIERTIHIIDTIAPTISLHPGVDTLFLGEIWMDSSVLGLDNYTNFPTIVIVENTVDNSQTGEYYIIYEVTDESGNTNRITRYVTIVEPLETIEFECQKGKTTYHRYDVFSPLQCTINGVSATAGSQTIQMNLLGTQEVIYTATILSKQYEVTSYIFILDTYQEVVYIDFNRKRGVLL